MYHWFYLIKFLVSNLPIHKGVSAFWDLCWKTYINVLFGHLAAWYLAASFTHETYNESEYIYLSLVEINSSISKIFSSVLYSYIYELLSDGCNVFRLWPICVSILKRSKNAILVYEIIYSVDVIIWFLV